MAAADFVIPDAIATISHHEKTPFLSENTPNELDMLDVDEAMRNLTLPPEILMKEDFVSRYALPSSCVIPHRLVETKRLVKDAEMEAL
jgi:hypothetical protein